MGFLYPEKILLFRWKKSAWIYIIPAIVHRYTSVLQRSDLIWLDKNKVKHPIISNEAVARVFMRLLHELYVGRIQDLLGRVPLIPCFLDGNATSTIPHKYASRQKTAFECGCADGPGPASRKGSHVYEINTWLWSFGRPQPRVGGLSVSKAQRLRMASRSEAAKRGWVTRRARPCAAGAK